MGNAGLYANDGSGVSDNGAHNSNGEVMDGDLEDKEEENEDKELGERSYIIH